MGGTELGAACVRHGLGTRAGLGVLGVSRVGGRGLVESSGELLLRGLGPEQLALFHDELLRALAPRAPALELQRGARGSRHVVQARRERARLRVGAGARGGGLFAK